MEITDACPSYIDESMKCSNTHCKSMQRLGVNKVINMYNAE